MNLHDHPRDHVVEILRGFQAGRSVAEINRNSRFHYRGCAVLAFQFRDQGYAREVYLGEEPVIPPIDGGQSGWITSWGKWRGELTEKGQALLDRCTKS